LDIYFKGFLPKEFLATGLTTVLSQVDFSHYSPGKGGLPFIILPLILRKREGGIKSQTLGFFHWKI